MPVDLPRGAGPQDEGPHGGSKHERARRAKRKDTLGPTPLSAEGRAPRILARPVAPFEVASAGCLCGWHPDPPRSPRALSHAAGQADRRLDGAGDSREDPGAEPIVGESGEPTRGQRTARSFRGAEVRADG